MSFQLSLHVCCFILIFFLLAREVQVIQMKGIRPPDAYEIRKRPVTSGDEVYGLNQRLRMAKTFQTL